MKMKLFSDKENDKKNSFGNERPVTTLAKPFENANVKIQKNISIKMDEKPLSRQKKWKSKMCGQHNEKKNAKSKCFGQKHECDWFLRKKSTLNTKFWIHDMNFFDDDNERFS